MQFSLDRSFHFSPFCPFKKKKTEKEAMVLFPMLLSFWELFTETVLWQCREWITLGLSSSTDGWCLGNLLWGWGEASDTKCEVSSQKYGHKSWKCCNEKQVMTQKETKALFLLDPHEVSDLFHINFKDLKSMWHLLNNSHNYFHILILSTNQNPDSLLPQLGNITYFNNLF